MKREPSEDTVPRFGREMTSRSGSQAWSHTAQVDPEERGGRAVAFNMPTRRTPLRRTMASRAQWPESNSRAWRPGSMSSIPFPQPWRGGFIDRYKQVPPEVRVPRAPAGAPAPAPIRGQAAAGMTSLPGTEGQIPTGPAAWRQMRGKDNAAEHWRS